MQPNPSAENATPVPRSDIAMHGMFFAMAAVVIGLSFIMNFNEESRVYLPGLSQPLPSMCSSRNLMGIDCPGCGMTRSFIAISHGRWNDAWNLNRASFLFYGFVFAQLPWRLMQICRLKIVGKSWQPTGIYGVPIFLVAVLAINWCLKLAGV